MQRNRDAGERTPAKGYTDQRKKDGCHRRAWKRRGGGGDIARRGMSKGAITVER